MAGGQGFVPMGSTGMMMPGAGLVPVNNGTNHQMPHAQPAHSMTGEYLVLLFSVLLGSRICCCR